MSDSPPEAAMLPERPDDTWLREGGNDDVADWCAWAESRLQETEQRLVEMTDCDDDLSGRVKRWMDGDHEEHTGTLVRDLERSRAQLEAQLAERTARLDEILALDFDKSAAGHDDFYSGPDRFVRAWLIAHRARRSAGGPDDPSVMGGMTTQPAPPPPSAADLVEWHVRQIEMICDSLNLDPAQWLNDDTAQSLPSPPTEATNER